MIKKTLYFGNPTYLSLRLEQLVIQLPEVQKNDTVTLDFKKVNERTVPIEDIGIVILDNQRIIITSGVVEALLKNNRNKKSRLLSGIQIIIKRFFSL